MVFIFQVLRAGAADSLADPVIRHESRDCVRTRSVGLHAATAAGDELMAQTSVSSLGSQRSISCDEALKIARLDAEVAYRDLSPYRIQLSLEPDGWHVDYELKDPGIHGGGPHYVIDALSGRILSKTYEQ
jgi:hypothetical protein